jgi:hypothetical protein
MLSLSLKLSLCGLFAPGGGGGRFGSEDVARTVSGFGICNVQGRATHIALLPGEYEMPPTSEEKFTAGSWWLYGLPTPT